MERQHIGILLGFAIGSAALWVFRSPEKPAAPAGQVAGPMGPALSRPVQPLKTGPRYPGSLDLFVDSNHKAAAGLGNDGDSTPRVNEAARAPVFGKGDLDVKRVDDATGLAAAAAGSQAAVPEPALAPALLLRIVGVGAGLVALLAWLSISSAAKAPRALWWASLGAALALAGFAVLERARGAGNEALAWAGVAAFLATLAASRLKISSRT